MIKNIQIIIGLIAGLALGLLVGWLGTTLFNTVKISNLEAQRDRAVLEKMNMRDQWSKAINELNKTKVFLNDTLAALELLRRYQMIDDQTKRDINKIERTLNPNGDATEETYDEFRRLIEEINRKNEEYNTASFMMDESEELNIEPFIELNVEAEKLFREATDLLLQYKE